MNTVLPPMIKSMLASAPVRTYHHLWHLVRNEQRWNGLTQTQRQELIDLGWTPPRFERQPGSGLDFLFMHREMIEMVNKHLAHMNDPNYTSVIGWNPIPYEHDDEVWPMPALWQGAERAFQWAKDPRTTEHFRNRVSNEFRNTTWVRGLSLDEYGSELEWTIHGWFHLHWSEQIPSDPWEDSPSNDWLGAPYSSHVNNAFWKLHGWIDESIAFWEQATGENADFSQAWAGAPGYLPEMAHTANPELMTKMNVREKPLSIMTWKVPIIEGVNEEDIVIHELER
ncbi:hypothetical protein OLMES_3206 [Oleiphilus messinensis]|uniref:Uncharacterized protein n=1 Tax=Oleiphilus messinensis TaxID=141451 RepID=A0A1Y0I9P6_9GAMM|nr:hypothetical protein [Oleiphilus messinensis]ARU57247.1 hypothetical protein OLMES_3206 [Oleiphilus messinensis]